MRIYPASLLFMYYIFSSNVAVFNDLLTRPGVINVLSQQSPPPFHSKGRDTGNSSIHLFRALTSIRYHDSDDLMSHLDNFCMVWTRMAKRTMTSSHTVAKAMKPILNLDEVKGLFFLTTLPDIIDKIIDNPSTQNLTSISAIKLIFQDIAEKHSIGV
jgi:hypothetical protein